MKKTERFNMKVDEQFLKDLDKICETKPGIRTRTAAVHYCIDVVMMGIGKAKTDEEKIK
jgi:hypothetical protein